MDNLHIYNQVREVPDTAKREIQAGRLKGKSDINPMWRIKVLTEQFGPCGVGWKYEITDKRLEQGAGEEIAAFVDINLYIKHSDSWSEAIPGTGGSAFVTKEQRGLHTSDECFKMALTDAISVSCKALGIGADVYWSADNTKYTGPGNTGSVAPKGNSKTEFISDNQAARIFAKAGYEKGNEEAIERSKEIVQELLDEYGIKSTGEIKKTEYNEICEKAEVLLAERAVEA